MVYFSRKGAKYPSFSFTPAAVPVPQTNSGRAVPVPVRLGEWA
ncbi:hypothetical protein KNP414_06501 [Paenibacillus mucilaginosus KNP414]|uniref:Uncharacterized protein n=1 Tax=Paenibacillus mucilaginosus (strain KNP414) TaxID=1036673 RepID=F8FNV3_PAEMK|nr:hypothetical protein KNP414_06501 [Paenibacillus mucilaginosus KNP414]